ncbi:unnamed protein product [Leptosia nina]|uniref:Uncharacterized protein n=1 Tax=Leptosia nina TaxID=320188 RepID=A0AAV1JS37_9NEOP
MRTHTPTILRACTTCHPRCCCTAARLCSTCSCRTRTPMRMRTPAPCPSNVLTPPFPAPEGLLERYQIGVQGVRLCVCVRLRRRVASVCCNSRYLAGVRGDTSEHLAEGSFRKRNSDIIPDSANLLTILAHV